MERFKKLLVCVDSNGSENAINRAVALAMENDATLTLMEVIKPVPRALGIMADMAAPQEIESMMLTEHRQALLQRASEYSDTAVVMDVVVTLGDPATEIIHEVLRHEYDLVIKSAEGFAESGRLFGSTAQSLLRLCPCTVLLLKPAVHGEFDQVVAAVDVDASDTAHHRLNETIVQLACAVCREDNATLHLAAAWDFPMEKPLRRRAGDAEVDLAIEGQGKKVRESVEQLLDGAPAEIHVTRGLAASAINDLVEDVQADLLIMGTVCRTGVAGFLIGNTAETVLAGVTCSVLALKPDGFVCPMELSKADQHLIS